MANTNATPSNPTNPIQTQANVLSALLGTPSGPHQSNAGQSLAEYVHLQKIKEAFLNANNTPGVKAQPTASEQVSGQSGDSKQPSAPRYTWFMEEGETVADYTQHAEGEPAEQPAPQDQLA